MNIQSDSNEKGNALPIGTRLHEFRIERVIGEGGFSIVYLAADLQLHRTVALKEYIPANLAKRSTDQSVTWSSERHKKTFQLGLESFVNESRLLASFDHPSLMKVYRFWESNGTAYMAMPFYEGPTLSDVLATMRTPPGEEWLGSVIGSLLDALELIHANSCFHRDIAPDNILLIGVHQKPLLLDFGAARKVIGDATQALTVILKSGYAPVEQYAEDGSMKQGAWTDVYAVCAVMYRAITGRPPPPSIGRLVEDNMAPASSIAKGKYSAKFLAAIDHGLAVRPEHRTQSASALRAEMFCHDKTVVDDEATVIGSSRAGKETANGEREVAWMPHLRGQAPAPSASGKTSTGLSMRKSFAIGGAVVVVCSGALSWFASRDASPLPGLKVEPATQVSRPHEATGPATPQIGPQSTAPPGRSSSVAKPARASFTPQAALENIVAHASSTVVVNARAEKSTVTIGKDALRVRVSIAKPGHVYVLYSGTGDPGLSLVFPNSKEKSSLIAPGVTLALPRRVELTATGPAGDDFMLVIVSEVPRDFSSLGLRDGNPRDSLIAEFDLQSLRRSWTTLPAHIGLLSGTEVCVDSESCKTEYGASMVRIVEVAARR